MQITEQETIKLKSWASDECNKYGKELDLFDINAEIDSSLTYSENKNILQEKFKLLFGNYKEGTILNLSKKDIDFSAYEAEEKQQVNPDELLTYENLEKIKTIGIYGETGSGKTAIAFKILEQFKEKKPIYFIRHPKPELLKPFSYKNLPSLHSLELLNDCAIYIDEPQLYISIYEKRSNEIIAKLCSLARQRNITLIISSSDTRVFTKHNEAYIDLWLIKDLDFEGIKNGSKIKRIIKDNCFIDPKGFKLNYNEYLSDSRKLDNFNGKHSFSLISGWNEELSIPYKNRDTQKIKGGSEK